MTVKEYTTDALEFVNELDPQDPVVAAVNALVLALEDLYAMVVADQEAESLIRLYGLRGGAEIDD